MAKYIDKIKVKTREDVFEEHLIGTTSDLVFEKNSNLCVGDQIKALEERVGVLENATIEIQNIFNDRLVMIERLLELAEQDPEAEPITTIEDRLQLIEETLGLQAPEA